MTTMTDRSSPSPGIPPGSIVTQMAGRDVPLFVWFVQAQSALALPTAAGIAPYRAEPQAYQRLAQRTGGRHAWLEDMGQGWPSLYEQAIVDIPLPDPNPEAVRTYRALYAVPLTFAIILFVLSWSPLPRMRMPGHAAVLAVLALGLGLPVPPASARDTHEQAWAAYEAGDWARAAALYRNLGDAHGHAGAGVSALQAGRAVEALPHLELAWMLAADDETRLDALFNLAYAHAALGRWDAALEAWRRVARSRPDDERVQRNIEVAAGVIQRRSTEQMPEQDLYGRRGSLGEGIIDFLGTDAPEPDAVTTDRSGNVSGQDAEPDSGQRGMAPVFVLGEHHAASGRIKVERLSEQPLRLRQELVRQDQSLPTRVQPATGAEAGQ